MLEESRSSSRTSRPAPPAYWSLWPIRGPRVYSCMALPRPGCLVRSTLALLGVLFVPLGIWFLRDDKHRYVIQSVALFIGALVCFYFAFRRDTWLMAALDGLEE